MDEVLILIQRTTNGFACKFINYKNGDSGWGIDFPTPESFITAGQICQKLD